MTEPECELKFTIESSLPDPGITEVKGIPVTRGDSMWIKDLKPEILSQLCTRRVGVQFMLPADFVITVKDGAENLVGVCVIRLEESAIQINGVCSGPECSQPLRLGSQLIDLTEDIGRQLGKPKIRLVSTPQAYKFYLKKGFKVVPDPENITKQSEMIRPIPQVRAGTRRKTRRRRQTKRNKK